MRGKGFRVSPWAYRSVITNESPVRIRNEEFSLPTPKPSTPNSQLPTIYNNVLLFANTAFSWPKSISALKVQIFLTFLPESFGDTEKSYTFASAFENERNLKQNEIEKSSKKANKERVLWKDLHKTDKVVQEARMMKHSFLGRRKTNRQVCLTLNSNLEARSETDTNKCRSLRRLAVKDILQCRVWSWLRMNASYRLNTCKSRGSMTIACYCWWRPAHGWVTRIQPALVHRITRRKAA